jgi:predicted PurR-regulated permease PerM
MMDCDISPAIIIPILMALIIFVILRPLIYTLIKCKGMKKIWGLKYTSIIFLVFIVFALIATPLGNYFNTINDDLALALHIVLLIILFYIAFRFMKRTRADVEKLNANNNQQ